MGKITISRIANANGGIKLFRYGGKSVGTLKDLLRILPYLNQRKLSLAEGKYADATEYEIDHCYETTFPHRGGKASDVVIKYHADVVLVFSDGTETTVGEAVARMATT